MPVSYSKMVSNTARLTFQVGEDTLNIDYYPNKVTDKAIEELDKGTDALNTVLASLIKWWDFFEDDEQTQMFPIDPERFHDLGLKFRIDLAWGIIRDVRPEIQAPQIQS